MQLPIFFAPQVASIHESLVLEEDTSRHVSQVLRMRPGEALQLTNGSGTLCTATLTEAHKKHSTVSITAVEHIAPAGRQTAVAISLLKNANRFEWFLEKATELGIRQVVPLVCERTERQHFRADRMNAVLVSAMLQSRQAWLPALHAPVPVNDWLNASASFNGQRFIAHCLETPGKKPLKETVDAAHDAMVLIGPEGDFTPEEIAAAEACGFVAVSLGNTRLRTETAGIVAAAWLA